MQPNCTKTLPQGSEKSIPDLLNLTYSLKSPGILTIIFFMILDYIDSDAQDIFDGINSKKARKKCPPFFMEHS